MKKTIKIIDLITIQANGKELPKKLKVDDDEYEYNRWVSDYTKIGEKKNYCLFRDYVFDTNNNRLNKEVEILDEEEFEDITELSGSIDETTSEICRFNNIEVRINQLIKNQKILIEKNKENK